MLRLGQDTGLHRSAFERNCGRPSRRPKRARMLTRVSHIANSVTHPWKRASFCVGIQKTWQLKVVLCLCPCFQFSLILVFFLLELGRQTVENMAQGLENMAQNASHRQSQTAICSHRQSQAKKNHKIRLADGPWLSRCSP